MEGVKMETYAVVIEITTYSTNTTKPINSKNLRKPPPPPKRKMCIIPDDTFVQIHLTDEDTSSGEETSEIDYAIKKLENEKISKYRWNSGWCCLL